MTTPKTIEIQKMICKMEVLRRNLVCENVKYLFSDWEMDVCAVNKNGYVTEYEVKVSKQDFKSDSKKTKWQFYQSRVQTLIPNYFYYCCPDGVIVESELPDFAGLLYAKDGSVEVVKKAALLHKQKHDKNKILLKFAHIMAERAYLGCCLMTHKNKKEAQP